MTFLLRCTFTYDSGETIHDETVICEETALMRIEKGMMIEGKHGKLVIEFDPPMVAEIAPE